MSESIQHVAIIMDGNRRWAKQQGLVTMQGHERGYETARKVIELLGEQGIKYVTLYTLSSENLIKRDANELKFLMRLLLKVATEHIKELHRNNIRLLISGRLDELSEEVQRAVTKAMRLTKHNTKAVVNLALNYGGRGELMDAVKQIVANNIPVNKINEEVLRSHLYDQGELPDPELIIRTGGQQRLSNFLPWQSVYSELYFTDTLWPDFDADELAKAIDYYESTKRNFGN